MQTEAGDLIANAEQLSTSEATRLALDCVASGIAAAEPTIGIRETLALSGSTLTVAGDDSDLSAYDRIVVLGGGNAAGNAASALEEVLGDWIDEGVVVTDNPVETRRIRMRPGSHPVPSDRGVDSTRKLLDVADGLGPGDLVVAPITGGGSALLAAPDGVALDALQATTESLLESGATIHEINAVRKHLSAIKGGQLARRLAPATTIAFLCSDVVGDDPSVVASGPLSPDPSTNADALAVLDSYDVDVPAAVRKRL